MWRLPALQAAALAALLVSIVAAPVAPGGRDASEAAARERATRSATEGRTSRELVYGSTPTTVLDVYRPSAVQRVRRRPGVLVVHGGGWRAGDKRRMAWTSRRLAEAGFVAFNVNYTLAAAGRPGFPRQLTELREAVRWIRRHAVAFGVDPGRIGAIGSSAGAHLAALLAVDARGELSMGSRVAAVVSWSAPFNLMALEDDLLAPAIETFLGCREVSCLDRQAAASPLTHVTADDPPTLIFNSEREMVPRRHAEEMAGRLAAAGVQHALRILPGSAHAREYAQDVLAPTVAFLRRWLR